ncbi:hypothetical protein SASPL_127128 [Salvia splendens]|uniref:Retrotransposon gag domain-containing protein n=1 Tax=Salvia splendens TaxID=180675 RepID=A0A8X8XN28_SALSN|nr:hypothetical protein SASPL_127128 [Salvia splendens]
MNLLLKSVVILEGERVAIDESLTLSVSEYSLPRSLSSWGSEEEGEQNAQPKPPPLEKAKAEMALVADDSGIGTLHAHDEKEPIHAIAITLGMRTIAIKSTSEDYRLKAIPFILKGNAELWLSRLPEGSIKTWAEFRMIFLDRFFPASKTSALKREITEARQDPGGFLKHPIQPSQKRPGEAKRSYETSRVQYRRSAVHAAEVHNDEKLEARFEQMEKKLLEAVEKSKAPPPPAPKEQ